MSRCTTFVHHSFEGIQRMAAETSKSSFIEEFEALKAKHGDEAAGLHAVRFVHGEAPATTAPHPTDTWVCRFDSEGFVTCEKLPEREE